MLVYDSRDDPGVRAYIGFRHVTGILRWPALEKAAYIAALVEAEWTYQEIAERLGHRESTVEKNFVAYQVALQAKSQKIKGWENMQRKFGVLMRALQSTNINAYLGITYPKDPQASKNPVTCGKAAFEFFVVKTFGTKTQKPFVPESRDIQHWGFMLANAKALEYIKSHPEASFEKVWAASGGPESSAADTLKDAIDMLSEADDIIGAGPYSQEVREAVTKLGKALKSYAKKFPKETSERRSQDSVRATG